MGMVPKETATRRRYEKYRECPKCKVGLDDLYVGGVGAWRTRIMCLKCFHVVEGVSREAIVALAAEQYGLSEAELRERDEAAQREYEAQVAKEHVGRAGV